MSVQIIYRHKPTGWKFVTESSSLPVAVVTGDLLFPLSDLPGVTIPLEVFQEFIKNSEEWEIFTNHVIHEGEIG